MATTILRPTREIEDDGWSPVGATDEHDACDPLIPVTHDDDSKYCSFGSGGAGNKDLVFGIDSAFPEQMASISQVEIHGRGRLVSGGPTTNAILICDYDGNRTSASFALNTSYNNRSMILANPPGGGSWTEAILRDPSFGFGFGNGVGAQPGEMRVTTAYAVPTFIPQATSFSLASHRDAIARYIRVFQHTPETYQVVVPYDFLDVEVMDEIALAHSDVARAASLLENLPIT